LKNQSRSWYALIGQRKIGKSSLIKEFKARVSDECLCVEVDCWNSTRNAYDFFIEYIVQLMDSYLIKASLAAQTGLLKPALFDTNELAMVGAKLQLLSIDAINKGFSLLQQLKRREVSSHLFEAVIDLPQLFSEETDEKLIIILDEFQELRNLSKFKVIKEELEEIFPLLRSRWQNHDNVNYIISGSKITMLHELLFDQSEPFYQHFHLMQISEFSKEDALILLQTLSADSNRDIPVALCEKIVDILGGNPFYLQVVGEELCKKEQIDEQTVKCVLQELLFNRTGRLSIYFQNLFERVVSKSSMLESVLLCLSEPKNLTEIAKQLGMPTGTANAIVGRLLKEDVIVKTDDKQYLILDKAFALWLKSNTEVRNVLPPLVLGDETEKLIARALAQTGFTLVYQSKASRGAFDLLAIANTTFIGIQCKRAILPYYLPIKDYDNMDFWAKKLSWIPLLALEIAGKIRFYSIYNLQYKTEKYYRIDEDTPQVENLLTLLT
jgi:AAA+ ATPase superfamily predicted ATPase/Holliday junction resolvase